MTQTKKDYLILKLILGVIVGILVGLYANDTHIQIIMTVKQIIGQVIFYTIPLIIVGFITPAIAGLKDNANKMLFGALGISYLSSIGTTFLAMFAGYSIIRQVSTHSRPKAAGPVG